jgi:outer membrane immunogenic protein
MAKCRALVAAVAVVGCASVASAADMPIKAPVAQLPVAYNWTGFYVGVNAGGAWGQSNQVSGGPLGLNISNGYNVSGGLVGGTAGYNWQITNWLIGLEGDFSWANIKGNANEILPFTPAVVIGTKENWVGTGRVRIGMTADRWLVYATGGFAAASVQGTINAAAVTGNTFTDTQTRWGWTGGGGVEYAFFGKWSAKLEYLYAKFQSKGYFNPSPALAAGLNLVTRSDIPLNNNIIRVGVNYRF